MLKKLASIVGGSSAMTSFFVAAGVLSPVAAQSDIETTSGASLLIWCCCMGIAILIQLGLTMIVYNDAKKNSSSPTLWALITFFFGLLGLLLYFIIGKDKN